MKKILIYLIICISFFGVTNVYADGNWYGAFVSKDVLDSEHYYRYSDGKEFGIAWMAFAQDSSGIGRLDGPIGYCIDPGVTMSSGTGIPYKQKAWESSINSNAIKFIASVDTGFNSSAEYSVRGLAIRLYLAQSGGRIFFHHQSDYVNGTIDAKPGYEAYVAKAKAICASALEKYSGRKAKATGNTGSGAKVQLLENEGDPYGGVPTIPDYDTETEENPSFEISGVGTSRSGSKDATATFSIDFKNLANNSVFAIAGVEFENDIGATVENIEVSIDGHSLSYSFGQDVLNGDKSIENVTVTITLNANNVTEDNCETSIKLKYNTNIGANMKILEQATSTGSDTQEFIVPEEEGDLYDGVSDPVVISLCEATNCEAETQMPAICENEDELDNDIRGNAVYQYNEGLNMGQENIKKCVLGKTDVAGNSFRLNDSTYAELVSNNNYCAISCKEKYEFSTPYKKDTEAGRYFQVRLGIKGQIDCYSDSLKYSQFVNDIRNDQLSMIENYNQYQYYWELVNWAQDELKPEEELQCKDVVMNCTHKSYQAPKKDGYGNDIPGTGQDESCDDGYKKTLQSTTESVKYSRSYTFKGKHYKVDNAGTKAYTDNGVVMVSLTPTTGTLTWGEQPTPEPAQCSLPSCPSEETGTCTGGKDGTTAFEEIKPEYENSMELYKTALLANYASLQRHIDMYNACIGEQGHQGESIAEDFWSMAYIFDPTINYSYEEPIMAAADKKWVKSADTTFYAVEGEIKSEKCSSSLKDNNIECQEEISNVNDIFTDNGLPVTQYCLDDADDQFSNCTTTDPSYATYMFASTTGSGCDPGQEICIDNIQVPHSVTGVRYVHKSATAKGIFDTPRVYYSLHDDGEVIVKPENSELDNSDVVDGIPVGSGSPQGTYYYILNIKNIGSFFNNSSNLGRVYGENGSVAEVLHAEGGTVTPDHGNEIEIKPNEYACSYTISENSCVDGSGKIHLRDECEFDTLDDNWDECRQRICPTGIKNYCVKASNKFYTCPTQGYSSECVEAANRTEALGKVGCTEGKECESNYNCCPNCIVECKGSCAYVKKDPNSSNSDLQIGFRPITPSNMNPNDREYGYNWNPANPTNVLVATKAYNTIQEIETRANIDNIENVDVDVLNVNDYTMKVKLTPSMTNWIKEYNNAASSEGGYNNDTLKCFDYTLTSITEEDECKDRGYSWVVKKDKSGTCEMTNIFCYSDFIDELLEEKFTGIDIKGREEALQSNETNWENYTSFTTIKVPSDTVEAIIKNDYWTIYRYTTLDINGDKIPDVGPSWK